MKQLFYLIIASTCLLASCKEEKDDNQPLPQQPVQTDTVEKIIEIKTTFGTMYMWLYKETPLHRTNFLGLADTNYFDNTTFHRIISGFMIQGGDPNSKDANPNNDGQGGPGYTVPAEINTAKLKHARGEVAAARLGNAQNPTKASSGSQFYICHSTSGTQSLNGEYTVFGKILKGIEVVDSIVVQPKNTTNNRPLTDIKMDVNVIQKTRAQIRAEFNFQPN
ncbi:MAG: peptidylprolyl isomerase [Bacteroidetes bacterium]|nr:MAG: peptidylprolyl isomerase [Bacteroidota bacterium]